MIASTALETAEPASGPLDGTLAGFADATPELILQRALLARTDTKFVFPVRVLDAILADVEADYAVLGAGATRLPRYRTLYFDTPDLRCFHDHRRGRRARHKVRVRHYPDRAVSFLEVKTKMAGSRTRKERLEKPYGDDSLGPAARSFVSAHSGLPADDLRPEVWIHFRRLTLVGIESQERVTIDVDLEALREGVTESLDGVAIAEVKQGAFSRATPIMRALRRAGLRPASASKYCIALARMRPGLRMNRLLPSLRLIEGMRT